MPRRLTPSERVLILEKVFKEGNKVASVCRQFGISRFTFYSWAKQYSQQGKPARKKHPRAISWKKEKLIIDLVLKNPLWSAHKICKHLSLYKKGLFKVSNHGIQSVLERHALNTVKLRENYSRKMPVKTVFPTKFTDWDKYQIINEASKGDKSIAQICRFFHISRFTYYAWLKKYEKERTVSSLSHSRPKGNQHFKYVGDKISGHVLGVIAATPEASVHQIHKQLASVAGHHAIQNFLYREGLNTKDKRILYAQQLVPAQEPVQVAPIYSPVMPMYRLRMLLSPFKTVPKLFVSNPKSGIVVFLSLLSPFVIAVYFLKIIFTTPDGSSVGLFFASVALLFGTFFFIYSMKYYITILMVLRLAQSGGGPDSSKFKIQSSKLSPLNTDLSKVELLEHPFVSIHVALYNEKRVVERLIRACTSQNWVLDSQISNSAANYEVVIADDSTDETTDIAKELLVSSIRYQVSRTYYDDELEIFRFDPPEPNLPVVKLIHRFARTGFKGAALQKALENTDSRTQYVSVFDADFVPYPDTIEQFIKTFQVVGGASAGGNIAAVQGYQWHVLNKSQTWVTRGVRTEYAGSYVIERSGAEIYGGLKQIAGSVYCIRADVLRKFGWGTSITEDFELTLRLYENGWKVAFTPYIQAPAEAVSTIKRLIRQRMRWAEGASHNIRIMLPRMLKSQNLTRAEKLEFLYLAPYYLQAAFFVVGTFSWFISEALIGVRLPFWTAAFGWSLVFTNLFALPLMNIVGLFLEESEEKDYAGIVSFIALSYVVVPFQAYAAIKGFLEPSEGPWFRTPKTGSVTDTFDRSGFEKFFGKIIGTNNVLSSMNYEGSRFAFASAYRPLVGTEIVGRRRHFRFASKSVLASLLTVVILLNYLAFFVPNAKAAAGSRKVEQQINVIDQVYSTTNTTDSPTDNSLGLVYFDSADYTGDTVYFEMVAKCDTCTGGNTQITATLYDDAGGTETSISTTSSTYTRVRSGSITLAADEYTIRIKVDATSGTAYVRSARIIVLQSTTQAITDTVSQHEMGDNKTTTSTSYTNLTDWKLYCFDSTSTTTTCSAASPSVWSPAPTIYFEATLSNNTGGSVAYAALYYSSSCITQVSGSEVSVTGTTWSRARSSSITLTAGTEYRVCIKASANTARIANAKIIFDQTNATGVTKLETMQVYNNTLANGTVQAWTRQNYNNLFDPANFSQSVFNKYFVETTVAAAVNGYEVRWRLEDETTPADLTGTINHYSSTYTRYKYDITANMPTASKTIDLEQFKVYGSPEVTVKTAATWLIVQTNIANSLEQQINMIDQEYTSTSTTLAPTDNSLGMIHYDSSKFSNISTVTFEALIANSGYTSGKDQIAVTTTATLYNVTDSTETASVTYSDNATSYSLATIDVTSSIVNNKDYTVRIKTDNASATAYIKAARIKVVQSSGAWLTATQTQVEVGNNQTAFTNTTYSALTDFKIYQYNDSAFTPTPETSPGDVEFHATLKIASSGDTVFVELYNNTNSTTVAELSHTGDTTWTLVTGTNVDGDSDWDTTNDDDYVVRVKCTDGDGGGCSGSISNAKIVLNQSDTTNGVTDLETVQQYVNTLNYMFFTNYVDTVYDNTFTPGNFGGTKTYIFEATLKTDSGMAYAQLENDTDSTAIGNGNVSTASTTYVRQRTSNMTDYMPTSSKRMDTQQKSSSAIIRSSISDSWLIIQISSMPVPELILFAAPVLVFVPKIVEWIKQRRLRRKEKMAVVLPI